MRTFNDMWKTPIDEIAGKKKAGPVRGAGLFFMVAGA